MDEPHGSGRAAKRIHQACEGCRRKKSRCPGEKPSCSTCARLGQQCIYADDSYASNKAASLERRMDERLAEMESKINAFVRLNQRPSPPQPPLNIAHELDQPFTNANRGSSTRSVSSLRNAHSVTHAIPTLPHEGILHLVVMFFVQYCNGHPLPLFHPNLKNDFRTRDDEVLFAVVAYAARFSEEVELHDLNLRNEDYLKYAQDRTMERIFNGPVRLATIQSLILLSFLDYHSGGKQRCHFYLQNAGTLSKLAGLSDAGVVISDPVALEERRRCAMCISILQQMYGTQLPFEVPSSKHLGALPASPGIATGIELSQTTNSTQDASSPQQNTGVIASQMPLWLTWMKTMRYLEESKNPISSVPLWSCDSDYAAIVSELLEIESTYPLEHRYYGARPDHCSTEMIHDNWAYWGTWLSTQLMYHNILTLLNHPVVVSSRVRSSQRCPGTFAKATSDLVRLHSNWTIRLLGELGDDQTTPLTNPFLGYCAAVAATVFLHHRSSEDLSVRQIAIQDLTKSMDVVGRLSTGWPLIKHMESLLVGLMCEGSTSPAQSFGNGHASASINDTRHQQSLWQLLTYCSTVTLTQRTQSMFCDSLLVRSNCENIPNERPTGINSDVAAEPALPGRSSYISATQQGYNSHDPSVAADNSTASSSLHPGHDGYLAMTEQMGLPSRASGQWADYGLL